MGNISTWSSTAANNNQATPDGYPEGQAASTLNDCARETMAAIRRWYEDAEWINWGHTPTRVSDTQFSVGTDQTAVYLVGRRVRLVGATTGYGLITASSYSAPNTTITVSWDSGTTPTSPTAASVGVLTPTNPSVAEVGQNVRKVKTADTTRTSTTTISDDDHLAGWALVAGARYSIRGFLVIFDPGQANFDMALQFSNAPQSSDWMFHFVDNNAAVQSNYQRPVTSEIRIDPPGTVRGAAMISGTFQANATTGGTLDFQWAQGSSSGTATELHTGSWIEITRLS